jgi:hypothetical protein
MCTLLSFVLYVSHEIKYLKRSGSVLVSHAWCCRIESWSNQNFYAPTTLLFYILPIITFPKFCIFRKSIPIHYCMALLQVTVLSTPPHKFVRPPCWYYRLYQIEKYDFWVVPIGVTSIPNFIRISPAVPELNHADRHDHPYMRSFNAHRPKNA